MRILVVDDFEPWRRFVSSLLRREPARHVVFEAADGLEAVAKTIELMPDLVILDIGLPKLNGFEAARKIHEVAPACKVLYVSMDDSLDYVEEALETGGCGYVTKVDAGRELETAVEDVLRGKWFISSRIMGRLRPIPTHTHTLVCFGRSGGCRSIPAAQTQRRVSALHNHVAQLYGSESDFLDNLTHFLGVALEEGKAALVVATEAHRQGVLPRLEDRGLDIATAISQSRYIALDAEEALEAIMTDGLPDRARFLDVMNFLVASASSAPVGPPSGIVVYGECAPLLWAQGEPEAAIRVEQLCNEVVDKYGVQILCSYPLNCFESEGDKQILKRICAEHSVAYSL